MRNFVISAINKLNQSKNWSTDFVELKLEFARKYQNGLIFSTVHGADFFNNVLDCLNGKEWNKKEYKGEYEDNFRKFIKDGQKNI